MKTNIPNKMKIKTTLQLLMVIVSSTVCSGFVNAATVNEWLFDTPPTGAQFIATNQVPGGTSMAELNQYVTYQNLQVAGGPFYNTVGGQTLDLTQSPPPVSGHQYGYAAQGVANIINWSGKTTITTELWVNPSSNSPAVSDAFFDGGNGIRLIGTAGGFNMEGFIFNGTYVGTTAGSLLIPYNTWTHIAMTYDGTTIRTYVGDQLDLTNTLSITTTLAAQATASYIGEFSTQNYLLGYIDEVRTSDVALGLGDGSGNGTIAWNASLATPVPEPTAVAMGMMAIGGFGLMRLIRRKRSS
ncbi:MAG: LamG domain-containing protein [Chthoniobacterales bacterium]